MSNDEKKDSSIEEQVIRVSNNFESDILRLIKTQSMIKTTGSIINEEIEYLITRTNQLKEKLSDLNIKSNELSDLLKVSFQDQDLSSTHVGLYLNEFIESVDKENQEIESLKLLLSERLKNGSEKLNSLHQFYIAELEAFQQEVDSGIANIREDIKKELDKELTVPAEEIHTEELPPEITEPVIEPELSSHEPNEEVETGQNEIIENEEEYYQKMFASSNTENDSNPPDDKFLYIALGFLLLCAVGFLGYYFKYIRSDNTAEMVILEELYSENSKEESPAENYTGNTEVGNTINTESDLPDSASLPLKEDSPTEDSTVVEDEALSETDNYDPEKQFSHTVLVKRANMRSGPGRKYGVVTVVTYGTSVAMLDEQSGIWTKILLPDGKEGWVARKLLSK